MDEKQNRLFTYMVVLLPLFVLSLTEPGHVQESGKDESPIDQTIRLIARYNFTSASKTIFQYLDDHPESGEAWFLLGVCRNRLGLYMASYEALSTARSLGVETKSLNREFGMSLQGRRKWRIALHYFKKADQNDPKVWLARAQVQAQLGNELKAKKAADRTIELDEALAAQARFARAYAHAKSGNIEDARKQLDLAMEDTKIEDIKNEYRTVKSLLRVFDKNILRFYRAIFFRKKVNRQKGIIRRVRIAGELRRTLARSISAYRERTGLELIKPNSFRDFVTRNAEYQRTLNILEDLQDLFRRMEDVELSTSGQQKIRQVIVKTITPDNLSSRQALIDLIQLNGKKDQ